MVRNLSFEGPGHSWLPYQADRLENRYSGLFQKAQSSFRAFRCHLHVGFDEIELDVEFLS